MCIRDREKGEWESHVRRICLANKKKHDIFSQVLEESLGPGFVLHGKGAGLHLVIESLAGLTEEDMIRRAGEAGIRIYPISKYWMAQEKQSKSHLVMAGFGSLPVSRTEETARALAKALSQERGNACN